MDLDDLNYLDTTLTENPGTKTSTLLTSQTYQKMLGF